MRVSAFTAYNPFFQAHTDCIGQASPAAADLVQLADLHLDLSKESHSKYASASSRSTIARSSGAKMVKTPAATGWHLISVVQDHSTLLSLHCTDLICSAPSSYCFGVCPS